MSLVDVGIRLIADQGAAFQKTMDEANRSMTKFIGSGQQANIDYGKLFETFLKGNIASQIIMRALDGIAQKLEAATAGSVQAAARFEQLTFVARLMAQRQGYSAEQTDELIQKLRDYRITAEAAADTVVQFTQYELDLGKAQDLVKVSQDAAVVSGRDTSETYQRILYGIQTYQTEVLRTVGINVRQDKAMADYAKTLHTSAQALTENQRQQAMLNAVLEEGQKIAGARAAADLSAATVSKSLIRVYDDLSIAIGAPFTEAWRQALLAETTFVKGMTAAIEEGGKLHWIIQDISNIAQVMAEGINSGASEGTNSFIGMIDNIARGVAQAASDAFSWGVNFVSQFASGIIEGAGIALSFAMGVIGSFLEMLMPGSPPPIAPDIDKWGAGTMTEWMKGFSEADFSVINSVEGIVRSAFQALGADVQAAGTGTKEISGGIVAVLAGKKSQVDLLNQIRGSLGMYGTQVADLVEKQIALARATEAVKAAEDALKKSREAEIAANENLAKIVDEYNALAKAGASPEILKAKRAEFELAKKTKAEAVTSRKAAEKDYENKSKGIDQLKEQTTLQESLVKQLIELTKVSDGLKGAGGGWLGSWVS